jgi:hypothetical protein
LAKADRILAGAGKRRPLSIGAQTREWYAVRMSNDATDTTTRSSIDDIIDLYKKDIDRTLIRENLKLTVEQRIRKLMSFLELIDGMRKGMAGATGNEND